MYIQHLAKIAFGAVTFIVCSSIALGQSMSPEERQRIMMVQDVKAVGNSGDKSLTPYLKDVLQSRKVDHREWADVQMALAKLGEREQQQQIVCVFYRGDQYEAQVAGGTQLPYIGGWFAIQLYSELLANKKIWSHWIHTPPEGASDEVMLNPQSAALKFLPKLIPDLPAMNEKNWKETQRLWPEYIRKHEAELSLLGPRGEGVDFSGASCKSKPRERSINE
jgi:hypothetical protein